MMVMKPEESQAVLALSVHALASLAIAIMDEQHHELEDLGALTSIARRNVDKAADIIARHEP